MCDLFYYFTVIFIDKIGDLYEHLLIFNRLFGIKMLFDIVFQSILRRLSWRERQRKGNDWTDNYENLTNPNIT